MCGKVVNRYSHIFITKQSLDLLISKVEIKCIWTIEVVVTSIVVLLFGETLVEGIEGDDTTSVSELSLDAI